MSNARPSARERNKFVFFNVNSYEYLNIILDSLQILTGHRCYIKISTDVR